MGGGGGLGLDRVKDFLEGPRTSLRRSSRASDAKQEVFGKLSVLELGLGHIQVDSYPYRSLIEGLYTF